MINAFFKKLMSSPPPPPLLPQIKELEAPRVPWAGRLKKTIVLHKEALVRFHSHRTVLFKKIFIITGNQLITWNN